ncbi:MAG: hypothetical protein DCO95_11030 [Roseivirga sp. XM-24bin3]|nr:MAG: hypothetical protein DCO95_11030 [Roseivirga sp. XM-24bin3]
MIMSNEFKILSGKYSKRILQTFAVRPKNAHFTENQNDVFRKLKTVKFSFTAEYLKEIKFVIHWF